MKVLPPLCYTHVCLFMQKRKILILLISYKQNTINH